MRHKIVHAIIALPALLLASNMLLAADDLQAFTAKYTVSTEDYTVGGATLSLAKEGNDWTMRLKTKPTGLFALISRGNAEETSLMTAKNTNGHTTISSKQYRFFQKKAKPGRNLTAEFASPVNSITVVTDQGETTTLHNNSEIYDPLSSMLIVIQQLQREELNNVELSVFSRGAIKTFNFEQSGSEDIKTPLGDYSAIRVTRKHPGSTRETHTWYATKLDYLPVRIEQYKRGELVARLSLTSLNR